jgi:hypothetical protein
LTAGKDEVTGRDDLTADQEDENGGDLNEVAVPD